MASLDIVPVVAALQGVINVPMFELPWQWPSTEFFAGVGWSFQHGGNFYPMVIHQKRVNASNNPYLVQQEAYIGNPFTFTYCKFPDASVAYKDSGQTTTHTPFFLYDRLYGMVSDASAIKWYSFWQPCFPGILNSVAASLPRTLVWNRDTDGRGFAEAAQGSDESVISQFDGLTLPTLAVSKFTLDSNANIRVFGRRYYDNKAFYNNLFTLVNINQFNPRYCLPNLATGRTKLVDGLTSTNARRKRPSVYDFTTPMNPFDFDTTAAWFQVWFDTIGSTELNDLFDVTITGDTATIWNERATYIGDKFLWFTPHAYSGTPNQNITALVVSFDLSKYWLLNFIPQDAIAAAIIGESATHMSGEFTMAGDPNGNLYVGCPIHSSGTDFSVLSSFGLNFAIDFPTPRIHGLALPCYGTCDPVLIQSQKI
jgi:hypothetical protein